ncbi:MAG: tetratricopeptide repeat protein [Gammaproteobacteria bacterium]|nr:tetratricopeptide repeat protein [Gammaproteobacteria bacterium]
MKKLLIKMMSALMFVFVSFNAVSADDAWMRSYTLETAGQYAAAAQSIEHFLKEIPNNEFAVLRSAWLYYLAENYSRSIKYYQTALEINKNSIDAMLGMSLPLMAQARWREAASMTQEVIKISKWNYLAHTRLMTCEDNLKQWETLKKHAETLRVYYPSDATILVYLARAYSHTNKNTKAKEAYQQVLQRYPGHLEASKFLSK